VSDRRKPAGRCSVRGEEMGHGEMLDHMLITRNLLAYSCGSEIHNEILHDESVVFAIDRKYPESDHAPVVATFDF
jgi:exonuclease III